jgi:predicted esterase
MELLSEALSIAVPLHVTARRPRGAPKPFPILVGLHGYAMNGDEMMEFLPRLAPDGWLLVSVEGPHSTLVPGAERQGRAGFHWGVTPRVAEVRGLHRTAVTKAIAWAEAQGGDPARVSLVGFSQPVSHGYRLASDPPQGLPFRAVVGICGGIPGEWADGSSEVVSLQPTAVFHASATEDPYYPQDRIAMFPGRLGGRFSSVTHRLYEGGHRIPSAALEEIRAFLARHG